MLPILPVNPLPMKHIRKTANGRRFSMDVEAEVDNSFVSLASKKPANDHMKSLVNMSWQGIRSGFSPTLCEAGVGGTYFMKDSTNRRIGVFKPQDEEMGCSNNPKGYMDGKIRGVSGGEAAFRECAAYVLDHDHFAGVPATDLVVCNYPYFHNSPTQTSFADDFKIGSFQEFKEHDFDAEDISPSKAAHFPVDEVHKIALFDIRLFNTDRHGGNILVRKIYSQDCQVVPTTPNFRRSGEYSTQFTLDLIEEEEEEEDESMYTYSGPHSLASSSSSATSSPSFYDSGDAESYELIPIDHGYTLPSTISGITDSWFEWLNWPQAKLPFTSKSKEYIAQLDADSDIALLRDKFSDWFLPETYKVLKVTTMWLKKGAAFDLTPYELGTRMCSLHMDTPSELEAIYYEAMDLVDRELETLNMRGAATDAELSDKLFFEKLANLMDEKMRNIVQARSTSLSSSKPRSWCPSQR